MDTSRVLIESDWNLKIMDVLFAYLGVVVLIESDWNLKRVDAIKLPADFACINRIRLEFKENDRAAADHRI